MGVASAYFHLATFVFTQTKMFTFYRIVLTCFGALAPLAIATAIPEVFKTVSTDVTPLSPSVSTVQLELGPCLSRNASIYFPNNPKFANATARWSASVDPNFIVVMVPGVENDVAVTVWICIEVACIELTLRDRWFLQTDTKYHFSPSIEDMAPLPHCRMSKMASTSTFARLTA